MSNRWTVVASRVGARVLRRADEGDSLVVVEELAHERGRMTRGELETDRLGNARHGVSGGLYEQHDDAHEHDAREFAAEIAALLERGRHANAFGELVLVAEPRFLGILKKALSEPCAKRVVGTVGKDLQHVETRDLLPRLAAD